MANADLIAPLASTQLQPGMVIAVEAIDPTTGNNVAGVVVSAVAVYAPGEGRSAGAGGVPGGNVAWLPVPQIDPSGLAPNPQAG